MITNNLESNLPNKLNIAEKNKYNHSCGITLITLVITIIILLILTSITINISLKNNNLFMHAKQAKKEMEKASIIEQIQLEIIDRQIENDEENISERDLEQILGKYGEVQKDETGKVTGVKTDKYDISLKDIFDVEKVKEPITKPEEPEKKITKITLNKKTLSIEVGKKQEVTITIEPGDIENKEVEWTSDNEEIAKVDNNGEITAEKEGIAIITVSAKNNETINDKCTVTVTKAKGTPGESGYLGVAYNDPYIPIGFKHIGTETWNSGYTIIGETESVGNEFVWVPCVLTTQEQQLAKNKGDTVQIFQKNLNYPKDNNIIVTGDTIEAEYIQESVGKYGGFYIAKYEAGIPGKAQSTDSNHNTSTSGNILPVSKPNIGVWNFISRTNALSLSNKMINYGNTGVHSTLISGAAWDTTMRWITNTVDSAYAENSNNKGNYSGAIAVTGSNRKTAYAKNNIYDMAGNVWEWTTEKCTYNGNNEIVIRGRWLQLYWFISSIFTFPL